MGGFAAWRGRLLVDLNLSAEVQFNSAENVRGET